MKRTISLLIILLLFSGIVSAQTGLPNPASVKCEDDGYKTEIRTLDDGSQYSVCVFEDSECDEWQYFREECKPKQCSKVEGYWECEEGCEQTEECCSFEISCEPYQEKEDTGFMATFKKYFYLIFAWLWLEEEDKDKSSFEKTLKEENGVEM